MSHLFPKYNDHFDGVDEFSSGFTTDYFQQAQYPVGKSQFHQMDLKQQARREHEELDIQISLLCSSGIPSMNMGYGESPRLGQRYGLNTNVAFEPNRAHQYPRGSVGIPSYSAGRSPKNMFPTSAPVVPKYAQQRSSHPEHSCMMNAQASMHGLPSYSLSSSPSLNGLPFYEPVPPVQKANRSPSSVTAPMKQSMQQQHQQQSGNDHSSDVPLVKIRGQGNRAPSGHVIIYQVQFKRGARHYVPGPRCPTVLAVGEFVVTQCSRGQDLGVVTEIMSLQQLCLRRYESKMTGIEQEEGEGNVSQIVRVAGMVEKQALRSKHKDENIARELTSDLALNKYHLEMEVLDSEFQFDRSRLTIYYTCESRVDFRDLVKELCAIFTIRIWMKEVKKNALTCVLNPKASTALATGVF